MTNGKLGCLSSADKFIFVLYGLIGLVSWPVFILVFGGLKLASKFSQLVGITKKSEKLKKSNEETVAEAIVRDLRFKRI